MNQRIVHRKFQLSLASLAIAAASAPALAQPERDSTTPTGWIWLLGSNAAGVNSYINQGFRVFCTDRVGADAYNTIAVSNSGVYAKPGAAWRPNLTGQQLSDALSAAGHRITSLDLYDQGGVLKMTASTTPLTGVDNVGWGWLYNQTPASITSWVANNPTPLRLIDLNHYTLNGTSYYAAVAVANTGGNFQSSIFNFDRTEAQVTAQLGSSMRLVDLEIHDAPTLFSPITFSFIAAPSGGVGWWWYYNQTAADMGDKADLNGARLTSLKQYSDALGGTKYAGIMVDNSNALTSRIRSILWSGVSDQAQTGCYLKRVGGSELASLGADHTFEPASMLKILIAAYCIDRCASGLDSLNNNIFILDKCNNNECPDNVGCNSGNELLSVSMREMLEQSDNNRTKAIQDRYGRATLNAYAASLNMPHTQLNHDIGCGSPPNHFALRDACHLYELIADGTLFSQSWQDTLYDLMIDSHGNGMPSRLNSIIDQEAAPTSLTAAEISAFKSSLWIASKGGSYGVYPPGSSTLVFDYTSGGWCRIPFKNALGIITNQEYVLGSFVNNEPNETNAANTNSIAFYELLREEIRAALQSWDSACTAPTVTNQPDTVSVGAGGNAAFTVAAAGTANTYRWYKGLAALNNGAGPGGSTISGVTGTTLTISNATSADNGSYRVVVTNSCGTATSSYATLSVLAPCSVADIVGIGGGQPADDQLTGDDFVAFINAFASGGPLADIVGIGGLPPSDGQITGDDFVAFINAFAAGCP